MVTHRENCKGSPDFLYLEEQESEFAAEKRVVPFFLAYGGGGSVTGMQGRIIRKRKKRLRDGAIEILP
jgi:hypothetical protein